MKNVWLSLALFAQVSLAHATTDLPAHANSDGVATVTGGDVGCPKCWHMRDTYISYAIGFLSTIVVAGIILYRRAYVRALQVLPIHIAPAAR